MQIQAADYPLQVEPAQVLGFDCGLGAGLRICIFFGNKTQIFQKNRLFRRFFCVLSSVFEILEIAVLWWFQWRSSGRGTSTDGRRNRQIPNPSLTGIILIFCLSVVKYRDFNIIN